MREIRGGVVMALSAVTCCLPLITPARAEQAPVSADIVAGPLTVSLADVRLAPVSYDFRQQRSRGEASMTIVDRRGGRAGWAVTLSCEPLRARAGPAVIPAGNLAVRATGAPEVVAADASMATSDPAPGWLPLDQPRLVLAAGRGAGSGMVRQSLIFELLVPAGQPVGTYHGTLSATISSGP